MGIKYFFSWLKKTFSHNVKTLKIHDNLRETIGKDIDHFLVDMNGIFHYCCQKTYQYGSFKPRNKEEYKENPKKTYSLQKQLQLFDMIGKYVDRLIRFVQPKKRVVLAIDGPAPLSKQCQQRSRRYRSAVERDDGAFDSNCITPGTKFLDNLSKYMEHFIRLKLQEGAWGDIQVVFSSEKVPGEGEHKLVKYVRDFGDQKDQYMIQGMDADLVMLSLATHYPNFHILRENPYRYEHEYYYIDISSIRENLVNVLLMEQSLIEDRIYINDFITMIFFTGNDFLPHIPTVEILDGGVENLFETYRQVVKSYGPITNNVNRLNLDSLKIFIGTLSALEIPFLKEKRSKPINFPDRLLEKHTHLLQNGEFSLNWETYRKEYYTSKMNLTTEEEIKEACIQYVEGLQWVLTYYTEGVSNWKWYYPHYYAPFLSDIEKALEEMINTDKKEKVKKDRKERRDRKDSSRPYLPFMQLLCVLPKQSKHLLPEPLANMMTYSPFFPDQITVDFDGKHNDWEGVVLLPPIDFSLLEKEYEKVIKHVDQKDKYRNINGKSFVYSLSPSVYYYKSFYGDIKNCCVGQSTIEL